MVQGKPSRRHHFVPQGYLRGFANDKDRIRVLALNSPRTSYVAHVSKVAVEKDLYTLDLHPERDTGERRLADVESGTLPCVRDLARRGFVGNYNERFNISYYIALQSLRGPEIREAWHSCQSQVFEKIVREVSDEQLFQYANESRVSTAGGRESTVARVIENERADGSRLRRELDVGRYNEMCEKSESLIPHIALRRWVFIRLRHLKFITGDQPVVGLDAEGRSIHRVGKETPVLYFPLTRDSALLMYSVDGVTSEHSTAEEHHPEQLGFWRGRFDLKCDGNASLVKSLNRAVAESAYRDIYCHPDDVKHLPEPLRTSIEGE